MPDCIYERIADAVFAIFAEDNKFEIDHEGLLWNSDSNFGISRDYLIEKLKGSFLIFPDRPTATEVRMAQPGGGCGPIQVDHTGRRVTPTASRSTMDNTMTIDEARAFVRTLRGKGLVVPVDLHTVSKLIETCVVLDTHINKLEQTLFDATAVLVRE
jgi:hypothetical protein